MKTEDETDSTLVALAPGLLVAWLFFLTARLIRIEHKIGIEDTK